MSGLKYYAFLAGILGVGIYSVSQINGTAEVVAENTAEPEKQHKQAAKDADALEKEFDKAEKAADIEDAAADADSYDDEPYDRDDSGEEDVDKIGE